MIQTGRHIAGGGLLRGGNASERLQGLQCTKWPAAYV